VTAVQPVLDAAAVTIWAAGIPAMAGLTAIYLREYPLDPIATDLANRPVRGGLRLAVEIAAWPVCLAVATLLHLTDCRSTR
jgi:hypothetical protein